MNETISRKQSKLRFRLSILFLGAAILCLSISHIVTSWKLYETSKLLQRLRNEAGYLHVSDADKIHVLPLREQQEMVWKRRIYLPKGRKYHVYSLTRDIPKETLPKAAPSVKISGG